MIKKNSKWRSALQGRSGKMSSMRMAFLLWMIALSVSWMVISLYHFQLTEIPSTVVQLTLALGATKVTHRVAEGNWEEIIKKIIEWLKNRTQKKSIKK